MSEVNTEPYALYAGLMPMRSDDGNHQRIQIGDFNFILTIIQDGVRVVTFNPDEGSLDDPFFLVAMKKATSLEAFNVAAALEYIEYVSSERPGGEPEAAYAHGLTAAEAFRKYGHLFSAYGLSLSREGGQFVKELLTKLQELDKKQVERKQKTSKLSNSAGFVYVLRSTSGNYKIGFTKNPANRLETFNVKLPFEVEFDILIQTEDMRWLERKLHDVFANKRVNGEWFKLDDADLDYIRYVSKLGLMR